MRRAALSALLCAARLAGAQGVPYTLSITPEPPAAGELFLVTVLLPGVEAGEVGALEPSETKGMVLVSMDLTPAVLDSPEGPQPGARVVYSFRAVEPGVLRLPRFEISVAGLPLSIGPLSLDVLPRANQPARAPYSWRSPAVVTRWQCFPAALEAVKPEAPAYRGSSLPAAPGLSLESSGGLSFVAIALEEGPVFLPATLSQDGRALSEARQVRVLPAPREISRSRAVGSFSVRLVRFDPEVLRVGEALTLRVEVRGKGNLPVLAPPEVRIRGPGDPGRPAEFSLAELRAVPGAYEGMTGRELRFVPEAPGVYIVEAEPLVFLDPVSRMIRTLPIAPLRIEVKPAPVGAKPRILEHPRLKGSLESYAARPGPLGEAAALAGGGEVGAALSLLEGFEDPVSLQLRGLLLLSEGQGVRALAVLGAAERRSRWLPGLSETLAVCEEAAGVGPRIRDRLPEPRIFWMASIVFLAGGISFLGLVRFVLRGSRRGRGRGEAPGWVGFALAVLSLSLAGVSALERRSVYAVVMSSKAYAVPSESGTPMDSFLGRAGIVAASAGDWTLVRFPDGESGWLREGDYLRY